MLTIDSLAGVAKPEYVLRPHQIARRLWVEALPKKSQFTRVWLPWSYPLIVNPAESIGWAIYSRGIYEMPLTEALWRLAQPGDIVVDGGANIGYATSILAARVGPRGKVHSFEPDPRSFGELQRNVIEWEGRGQRGAFVLHAADNVQVSSCVSGPHPHLLIGGGKSQVLYLLDRTNMGHFTSGGPDKVVQTLNVSEADFCTPAFWQNTLYFFGFNGPGLAYTFLPASDTFNTSVAFSTTASFSFPGSSPSVSSNGNANGIVWTIDSHSSGTGDNGPASAGPAVLHAFDATNLGTELPSAG